MQCASVLKLIGSVTSNTSYASCSSQPSKIKEVLRDTFIAHSMGYNQRVMRLLTLERSGSALVMALLGIMCSPN